MIHKYKHKIQLICDSIYTFYNTNQEEQTNFNQFINLKLDNIEFINNINFLNQYLSYTDDIFIYELINDIDLSIIYSLVNKLYDEFYKITQLDRDIYNKINMYIKHIKNEYKIYLQNIYENNTSYICINSKYNNTKYKFNLSELIEILLFTDTYIMIDKYLIDCSKLKINDNHDNIEVVFKFYLFINNKYIRINTNHLFQTFINDNEFEIIFEKEYGMFVLINTTNYIFNNNNESNKTIHEYFKLYDELKF